MSRHDGVSCDSCLKSNFRGKRYKCLICYDYDLCATCYEAGATTTRHTTDHPVQCIITRSDFDIFFGGEAISAEQPQSFSCPYCSKMGFTEALLQEHVTAEHADMSIEVVCPICASLTGGDPNHVTDDFAAHLTLEHRAPREFDEPTSIRHVRRIPHPGRGVSSARTRRATNMFSSGVSSLAGLSPSSRETMDPIAELLSQLSSVRSRAAAAQSVSTQLQQLEMQLQNTRQQLERLPRRQAEVKQVVPTTAPSSTDPQGATATGNNNNSSSNSLYLLARCTDSVIDEGSNEAQQERLGRSLFVQELLLSTLNNLSVSDRGLDTVDKLSDKYLSPQSEESDKSNSSTPSDTGPNPDNDKESAVAAQKSSTEAPSMSTKSIGQKVSVEKVGTKQKTTGSTAAALAAVGRGSSNLLPQGRSSGRPTAQYQSQGERSNSHVYHHPVMAVPVSGRGGGAYDADGPQPLPGRPGSGGRDREGRLDPQTGKRNMVKHLPTTKTSDREPPPH